MLLEAIAAAETNSRDGDVALFGTVLLKIRQDICGINQGYSKGYR